ncbi:MAG: prepilin-type N-terminal cleavage/methylation domain-containing protein [Bacilli bacterium]|nr:prepilin-type N-terminal cleavage/methylation domain-containing protein [Bacilli bacterium]MDD4809276.1 prepilin-type N-terminal cleavage/methylation domain-containing protein [Bacilli bacterium]
MKKNKGFTLVELIGIVVILAIIAVIGVPSVVELIKKSEESRVEEIAITVEAAAEFYVEQNRALFSDLDKIGTKTFLKVGTLIEKGFIEDNIKGVDLEDISNYSVIVTVGSDNVLNYRYTNRNSDTNGYAQNNLILHFDGHNRPTTNTWFDLSGGNNNGTLINFDLLTAWTGNSVKFDGINDYIDAGTNSKFNITNELTMEVVFKMPTNVFKGGLMIKGSNGGWATNSYVLRSESQRLFFNIADGTTNNRVSSPALLANKWYHLSVTTSLSSGKLVIYIDGKKHEEANRTILNMVTNAAPLLLGMGYGSTTFFEGEVASARLYNRALTLEEIKSNYEIDKDRFDI